MDAGSSCHVCRKLHSSKALNQMILAGLLTYSIFGTSFPFLFAEQWFACCSKDFGGAYSSGSVQDSHLIPFSSFPANAEKRHQNWQQSYEIILIRAYAPGKIFFRTGSNGTIKD
jgi:hypothetical protein